METTTNTTTRNQGASRRVVSLGELHERFGVPYTRQHLHRRMRDGTFPKAVKLGAGKFARRAWFEDDILEWLDRQAAEREEVGHD
ncbi:MAG TPA: AlpA family phage regulatory protein [Devosiaceae bacterium]|jgi:predicted DNA-binding transcriptional regulator AlpA|nr:AlpA family phage regulatory protein [Devosiaceae bacterium]